MEHRRYNQPPQGHCFPRHRLYAMRHKCMQILGITVDNPVDFMICWTPDGCDTEQTRRTNTGGTGQAIALASKYGIPIINMNRPNWKVKLSKLL